MMKPFDDSIIVQRRDGQIKYVTLFELQLGLSELFTNIRCNVTALAQSNDPKIEDRAQKARAIVNQLEITLAEYMTGLRAVTKQSDDSIFYVESTARYVRRENGIEYRFAFQVSEDSCSLAVAPSLLCINEEKGYVSIFHDYRISEKILGYVVGKEPLEHKVRDKAAKWLVGINIYGPILALKPVLVQDIDQCMREYAILCNKFRSHESAINDAEYLLRFISIEDWKKDKELVRAVEKQQISAETRAVVESAKATMYQHATKILQPLRDSIQIPTIEKYFP